MNDEVLSVENGSAVSIKRDILPELLGYQLRRAATRVYGSFGEHLRGLGLTQGQFGVLVLIGANPGLPQTALAQAIGSNRSLMVRTIDRLEAADLVRREASPTDRRSHAIVVTDAGRAMIDRLKTDVRQHEDRVAGALDAKEFDTLLVLLAKLNDS
jgi:DNA-binding MarR family transcriptional regulator